MRTSVAKTVCLAAFAVIALASTAGYASERGRRESVAVQPARASERVVSNRVVHVPQPAARGHDDRFDRRRGDRHDRDHLGRSSFGISFNFGRPALAVTYCEPVRTPVWVPGYYVTETRQILVEDGHWDKVWVPAQYGWRYDAWGRRFSVMIAAGHWEDVWTPPRYETQAYQVWMPGYWQ